MSKTSSAAESPDHYEEFVRVFTTHEPDLRRFIRSLLPTQTDADDVLQQTALVVWRKFDQYDPETHFMKWACVIARFEALAYRRKIARDRLVFREDILDLMAAEGMNEIDERSAEHRALEVCLRTMTEQQRKFLTMAYTSGIKVKEMAEESGSTAAAFYMRLKRLRAQLQKCVEKKILSPEETA
ncbi:MAG: sigma-70 family RNA polymerase sigma factor [Roseibacillus sp.]